MLLEKKSNLNANLLGWHFRLRKEVLIRVWKSYVGNFDSSAFKFFSAINEEGWYKIPA